MPSWLAPSRVEFLGCLNDKYNSDKFHSKYRNTLPVNTVFTIKAPEKVSSEGKLYGGSQ